MVFLIVFWYKGYSIYTALYVQENEAISGEITGLDSMPIIGNRDFNRDNISNVANKNGPIDLNVFQNWFKGGNPVPINVSSYDEDFSS